MLDRRRLPLILLAGWLASASVMAQVSPIGPGRGPLERVAWVSDEAVDSVFELYSGPVDGSAPPVRLNAPLPAGGDVTNSVGSIRMSQSVGARVLYVADELADGVHELFSVLNHGRSAPVRLSGPMVTGGDVHDFVHGKERVVYRADQTVDGREELFSAPLDGSATPLPLTPGLDARSIVDLTADGARVVFVVSAFDQDFLHVVPIDGSQPPTLLASSGAPAGIAVTFFDRVRISPSNLHAVYIAAEDDGSSIEADLFSVLLDGSAPAVRLNQGPRFALVAPVDDTLRISPDGQRVLFAVDARLQSVVIDGTGLVNLVPAGESALLGRFRISADSQLAVFGCSSGATGHLYSAHLDGSQVLQLAATLVTWLELVPGATTVVYAAAGQMYAVTPPDQPVQLTGALAPGSVASSGPTGFKPLQFCQGGKRVAFRYTIGGVTELYSVRVDATQPALRLNPPLSGQQDVQTFGISADSRYVLYGADQSANDVFEVFSVRADGSGAAVTLNAPPATNGDVIEYRIEPEQRAQRAHAAQVN